jgi:hypothetical protein
MSDSTPSPHDGHVSGSHFQPSLSVVFVIVILFVGATFFMVRATAPSSATTTTTTTSTTGTTTPTTTRIVKSQVRVQVANGTTIPNLASRFTQTLTTQDWDALPPVNGPHVTATIIYYNPNFKSAALQVATTIGVSASAVHPLNGLNPVAGASGDDVIVVLGPNSGIK